MINKKNFLLFTGIVFSVLLLWISLRNTDMRQIGQAFLNTRPVFILPFIISLFAYYWLKAHRWALILNSTAKATTREIYPPMMIGYAGSLILPMQLGELIRVYLASKILSVRNAPVLTSVILERLFDFFTLLLIIGLTAFYIEKASDELNNAFLIVGVISIIMFTFIFIYIFLTKYFLGFIELLLYFFSGKLKQIIIENIAHGVEGLSSVRNPRKLFVLILLSLLQWCFMGICIYLSIIASGIDISIPIAFLVLVFVIIGVTLPTSPGYIGSIQAAYYFALTPYGITSNEAFTASIFYHLLAYLSVLIVGTIYLKKYGLSLSNLKNSIENSHEI